MRRFVLPLLWFLLAACLVLALPGFLLRYNNEASNKSVLTVMDYSKFQKATYDAGQDIEKLLYNYKKQGGSAVALHETTIGDLIDSGNLFLEGSGEYLSSINNSDSKDTKKVCDLLSLKSHKEGTVLITVDTAISDFLIKRLQKRLDKSQYITSRHENKYLFYLNFNPEAVKAFNIGFSDKLVKNIASKGFEIVLMPHNPPLMGEGLIKEYEDLIKDNKVKYVIFDGEEVLGYPGKVTETAGMLKRNNVITGIIEAPSQVKYVPQEGIDEIIKSTGYLINRTYIISDRDLEILDGDELLFRYIRCVVDRNIRLIYIKPLKNPQIKKTEKIETVVDNTGKLNDYLASKGYAVNSPLKRLSSSDTPGFVRASLIIATAAAFFIYFMYLFGGRLKYVVVAQSVCVILAGIFITVFKFNPEQLASMYASIVYPSLSELILLKYIMKSREQKLLLKIVVSIGILLGINAFGAYTIVSSLSDIRYIMNTLEYRGVPVSYTVPLLLFVANYMSPNAGLLNQAYKFADYLKRKISFIDAICILVFMFAIFLYIDSLSFNEN